ncbi:MAG: ABC transporter substrate-binding protein [Bacteroidetes bacterium]|nr:ABC transporter substrate-binding protein [Bacteroidota bacterium]
MSLDLRALKYRHYTYLFCFLALLFCACHNDAWRDQRHIFNYNQASGVSSTDPAFASLQSNIWVVNQIYNGLLETDSNLNVIPALARSYQISDDGKRYTFHLRTDVFFHDDSCFASHKGRRFNAGDVVYSFKRLIDPMTAAKGAWVFNDKVDPTHPFVALNDSTVEIRLLRPFPALPGILTMQYCFIVPQEAVEKYGKQFRAHPVGTGPFRFSFWREGELMVLKKNMNYFERDQQGNRLPYLDAVRISFIDSKATEFLKFKLNELDVIVDLDAGLKDEVLTKSGQLRAPYQNRFRLIRKPYLNTEYFGVNLELASKTNSPLADVRIRKAINKAIHKKELITYLRNGVGLPALHGFVAPGIAGYRTWQLPVDAYDVDAARVLLKESGYDATHPLPEIVVACNSANEALCLFIANQLKQAGITMRVEVMQGKALNERMVKGDVLLFKASWIADYPDPESFLAVCYGGYAAPPNYTRFRNREFDVKYNLSMMQSDDTLRYQTYMDMDRILSEEQALIPLYYDETLDFVQHNIVGLSPNALNLLTLKMVKKTYH